MSDELASRHCACYGDDRYEPTDDEHVSSHQARPTASLEWIDAVDVDRPLESSTCRSSSLLVDEHGTQRPHRPTLMADHPPGRRAEPGASTGMDDTLATAERASHMRLAYGEIQVRSGELTIGIESLPRLSPLQRRLYDQAVVAAGVDPQDVLVVHISEALIVVEALDMHEPDWPTRTRVVAGHELLQPHGTTETSLDGPCTTR